MLPFFTSAKPTKFWISRLLPIIIAFLAVTIILIRFESARSVENGELIFNEINLYPDSREFIELKNTTSQTLSYDSIEIRNAYMDGEGGLAGELNLIIDDVTIGPNDYFVICMRRNLATNCDIEFEEIDPFYEDIDEVLGEGPWAYYLFDLSGTQPRSLDQISFGGTELRPATPLEFSETFITEDSNLEFDNFKSISRIPDGSNGLHDLVDLQICLDTPGAPNVDGACERAHIKINSGQRNYSFGYVDPSTNEVWSRDHLSLDGQIVDRTESFTGNTSNLFYFERCCLTGYEIPVPNGAYQVNLHFMELTDAAQSAGFRIFNVTVENALIRNLDIFAAAGGRERPLVQTLFVDVNDEAVDIRFEKIVQEPMINGIEIIPIESVPFVTPTPSATQIPRPSTSTPTPIPNPTDTPSPTNLPATATSSPVDTATPTFTPFPSQTEIATQPVSTSEPSITLSPDIDATISAGISATQTAVAATATANVPTPDINATIDAGVAATATADAQPQFDRQVFLPIFYR